MKTARRAFVAAATGVLAFPALGQGSKSLPRVVFLSHSSPKAWGHLLDEFRAGLRSLGYVDGRDMILDVRWAENRLDRIPDLIADVLALRPAVIVTHGSPSVAALQKATNTTPIVFAAAGDPVRQGFVKSYRRPDTNITGVAFNMDIVPKVYELVKMVMPAVSRIGVLVNPEVGDTVKDWTDVLPFASQALAFEAVVLQARSRETVEPAFVEATSERMHALVVATMAPFVGLHPWLAELQFKYRLPTFHGHSDGADAGGLASYAFPQEENYRRAAALVDRILKGGKPAEIPVEIPMRYEIAINLKTAQALGIKVPEAALVRAHKIIAA